jgi:hypothetical protein
MIIGTSLTGPRFYDKFQENGVFIKKAFYFDVSLHHEKTYLCIFILIYKFEPMLTDSITWSFMSSTVQAHIVVPRLKTTSSTSFWIQEDPMVTATTQQSDL